MKRNSQPLQNTHEYGLIRIVPSNIKKLRLEKGLSQEELAEISGYHRTYVGSVERGERNITLSTLESFANALSVHPSELLKND